MNEFYDAPDYAHPLQDNESRGRLAQRPHGGSMTDVRGAGGRVLCLIGGQYGSEGKGVIAAHIADRFDVHVRVGGPNAGHSFRQGGVLWKMRSLPCGWVNPNATLVIGAGAVVDLELLMKEITDTGTDRERVYVDPRAIVVEPKDRQPDYGLRAAIGATGEGVGPARARRLARVQGNCRTVGEIVLKGALRMQGGYAEPEDGWPFMVGDTVELLAQARAQGRSVLLEGTQGSRLSLIHGAWPFVTSADTGAAQLCADCGIAPVGVESLLVIRTFPIRVGGNSGPIPDEVTWDEVSKSAGRPVEEFTTVTGRLRRVAKYNARDVRKAMMLNWPTSVALMFLDYLYPQDEGKDEWECLTDDGREYVRDLQNSLHTFIEFVGTGGPSFSVVERQP